MAELWFTCGPAKQIHFLAASVIDSIAPFRSTMSRFTMKKLTLIALLLAAVAAWGVAVTSPARHAPGASIRGGYLGSGNFADTPGARA